MSRSRASASCTLSRRIWQIMSVRSNRHVLEIHDSYMHFTRCKIRFELILSKCFVFDVLLAPHHTRRSLDLGWRSGIVCPVQHIGGQICYKYWLWWSRLYGRVVTYEGSKRTLSKPSRGAKVYESQLERVCISNQWRFYLSIEFP